jgi:two-component system, LytTR family, response regulator
MANFSTLITGEGFKNPNTLKKIALPTFDGLIFIYKEDIILCAADGSYTTIYIKNMKKVFVSRKLKDYENMLADCDFLRVHNSFLINLNEVERYVKSSGGFVIMSNGMHISVSKRKKEMFFSAIEGQ